MGQESETDGAADTVVEGAKAPSTVEEKAARAKSLIATVQKMVKDGDISDGDAATKAHDMMEEVSTLGTEVRAAKLSKREDQIKELLEKFETSSDFDTPEIAKAITGQAVQLTATQVEDESFAKSMKTKETNMGASARVAGLFGFEKSGEAKFHGDIAKEVRQKALAEGTNAGGGYLVVPAYLQSLFAETRRQGNVLRRYGLLSEHPVESNLVYIPKGAGAATVGIVSENAAKPSADQSYSQVAVNIYTWAGISKVSNQLLQDSSPTAADLVGRELGTLLGNLEEQKILNGSGTGEPKGILTAATEITEGTGSTAQDIIDDIITMIYTVQSSYFMAPNAIVMHPRRLAFIQKGKDTATNYLFNPNGAFRSPGGLIDGAGGAMTGFDNPGTPSILGLPVITTANMPVNLKGGTNADAVIVGNFNEAHWFQRQDVTLDVSNQAGTSWESNQTWFRLEERAGFTAERYATAFSWAAKNSAGYNT